MMSMRFLVALSLLGLAGCGGGAVEEPIEAEAPVIAYRHAFDTVHIETCEGAHCLDVEERVPCEHPIHAEAELCDNSRTGVIAFEHSGHFQMIEACTVNLECESWTEVVACDHPILEDTCHR